MICGGKKKNNIDKGTALYKYFNKYDISDNDYILIKAISVNNLIVWNNYS